MAGRRWDLIRQELSRIGWPLAGLAALAVVLACVLALPPWMVQWELGAQAPTLTAADRAKAINDVRTTLLQGIGGTVLLLGAYFTYRQLQTSREQLEVARQEAQAAGEQAREQLAVAQQGQVTERFTRAIDQLGSPEVDVRIGGIYALERIARDSTVDRIAVVEVLAAFIRNHAPWPPGRVHDDSAVETESKVEWLRRRMPDVQAAMTVLGRAHWRDTSVELQLNSTDLRAAYFRRADLRGAYLEGAHLESTVLSHADLRGAYLANAHLQGASLRHANLKDAKLQSAELHGADLRGARADTTTTWPPGFDYVAAGVALEESPDGRQS